MKNNLLSMTYDGKIVLDFEEIQKFDSITEIQNYYFSMSTDKDYQIQLYYTYRYDGHGHIGVEGVIGPYKTVIWKELQVGELFQIGYPDKTGRFYLVETVCLTPELIILKIEQMREGSG